MAENANTAQTVGEILAARRREQAIDLADVEAATRVRAEYLDAIETMDRRRLPDGPYAAGFVRSYAQYLGLDANGLAAQFRAEMAPVDAAPPLSPPPEPVSSPLRLEPPSPFVLIVLAAGLGLIALLWTALSFRPAAPEEVASVEPVPDDIAQWAEEDPARSLAAGVILVDGPTITLRARIPAKLEILAPSGRVVFARQFERDEVYEVPPYQGLLVAAANAGAIEVLRDGVSLGRIGPAGVPVSNWSIDEARGVTPVHNAVDRQETAGR